MDSPFAQMKTLGVDDGPGYSRSVEVGFLEVCDVKTGGFAIEKSIYNKLYNQHKKKLSLIITCYEYSMQIFH